MEYFWNTFQIVLGVITPLLIWLIFAVVSDTIKGWRQHKECMNERSDFFSRRWVLHEKKQPPNPEFTTLVFRSIEPEDLFEISVEKKHL